MRRIDTRTFGVTTVLLAGLFAGAMAGCSRDADRPKYRTVSGRITNVDLATGLISMSYRNERQDREDTASGKLAPEGEILIDGVTARLEDLQIGDQARVRGREEKRDGKPQFVAVRVEVLRRGSTQPAEE